jgi:hypothetical protein
MKSAIKAAFNLFAVTYKVNFFGQVVCLRAM